MLAGSVRPSPRASFVDPSVRFSFPDDNLSKLQWIFTKIGLCIAVVEIWFGIANGQILSVFDRVIWIRHDNGGVLLFNIFIRITILSFLAF